MALEVPPESPAARPVRWLRQQVAAGHAVPPEPSACLVTFLASGRADALSGRYLTVHDDVAALVERAAEIEQADLYTLRRRELT